MLLAFTTCFTYSLFYTYEPDASSLNGVFFCNADAKVEKTVLGYTPLWDPRLYFTVNIIFGQFSFSTVKVVDACWDAIVGRGGQMVAAVMTYRVLRRSLTLVMENCTVSIPTIASMYCQQVQLSTVWQLVHNIFWHRSSRRVDVRKKAGSGKLRLAMQIFTCTYVLLFATLVSIMTGYYGYGAGQVSELQPISQLSPARMVVFDGLRISLLNNPWCGISRICLPATSRLKVRSCQGVGPSVCL